jgi:hypothetical protein
MSATLNQLPDTATSPSSDQPPPSGRARPGDRRRRRGEMVIGMGLVVLWAVSSLLLLEPGWVGVVLLGALLLAAFHILVQRRSWRVLLLRDTASFARGWAGKLLVAAVVIIIPATMVVFRAAAAGSAGTPTTAGRRCSCWLC